MLIPKYQDTGTLIGNKYEYKQGKKNLFVASSKLSKAIGQVNRQECAAFVTDILYGTLDPNQETYVNRETFQLGTGNKGDAWERYKYLKGTLNTDVTKTHKWNAGDVVYLWRPRKNGEDDYFDQAQKEKLGNTHIGVVANLDKNGNPVIIDNRSGTVFASLPVWNPDTENYSIGGYAVVGTQSMDPKSFTFVDPNKPMPEFKGVSEIPGLNPVTAEHNIEKPTPFAHKDEKFIAYFNSIFS